MTQHLITPPPELIQKWMFIDNMDIAPFHLVKKIADQAAEWGANQELKECCEWLAKHYAAGVQLNLRTARRPPVGRKRKAMSELAGALAGGCVTPERAAIIRIALEDLPDD